MNRVALIVNPRSGGGRTAAALPAIVAAARDVFSDVVVCVTSRPREAGELAAQAVLDGAELVVAVGGDGTAHEVVDGLIRRLPPDVPSVFSVVPAGTGCDLARTLGIPKDPVAAMQLIARSSPRRVDALWARFDVGGRVAEEAAINIAGFGINGEVVRRANASSKRLGGRLTFLLATLQALASWRGVEVTVTWDGPAGPGQWRGVLSAGFLCNAQWCGGGILAGPKATMEDGVADLVVIPDQPVWTSLIHTRRLYDGTLHDMPGVLSARVFWVEVVADRGDAVRVDLDGEQPGSLPLRIDVLPGRLSVRAPFAYT